MRFLWFLIVLFNLSCYSAFSHRSTYKFLHLDTSNGLSDNQVKCIFKDTKGFMSFGTVSVLNTYDGHSIKAFKYYLGNLDSIAKDFVLRLFEGPDGRMGIKFYRGFPIFYRTTQSFSNNFQLLGFDKGWLTVQHELRKPTYTNPDAGSYLFKVRLANANGLSKEAIIVIKILQPFWKYMLAYLLYLTSGCSVILYIRYRGMVKFKKEFSLKQQQTKSEREIIELHNEAKRRHELDLMKIKIFTNVSHEFRTPLSLILAPIDKIMCQTENTDHKKQLQIINRNAKRLLNLVNQLLDFRKLESNELKLNLESGDIIAAIKDIVISFTDLAESKHIDLSFDSEIEELATSFDHDKIERILFNLLSNAFKFTHLNGRVSVLVSLSNADKVGNKVLEIQVIDTGIGIPTDKYDKIFNRFFQNEVPEFLINQGSGIGLAITKEFVKLHNGEIFVKSKEGRGSCFTVKLPLRSTNKNCHRDDTQNDLQIPALISPIIPNVRKVLIVEDDEDFRYCLQYNLNGYFKTIEAANGIEGWQKALAFHPDLIVSDISMPQMNGIDLCVKLKKDKRTSHIPVILLTVLSGEDAQLHGLQTGATDYITKPLNFQILISKVKNILSQQELTRNTFTKQVEFNPSKIQRQSPDQEFIQKALQIIDINIHNSDFSVEKFSCEMCMSRVTLYKKLLVLTGTSPVELIRTIRLKRATQLLEQGHLTVYQVCYKVGFKDLKYFNRTFKSRYNMSPSVYQSKIHAKTDNGNRVPDFIDGGN